MGSRGGWQTVRTRGIFLTKYFLAWTTENVVISRSISYNETSRVREEKNMITCRECGAPIEELAKRCPYCGAINELGAEHKYMQDMYDLKDDLKEVGNIPGEEIKAEVKSNVHFTGKAVAVLLALVLILAAVFLFLRYSGDIIYSVYNKMTDTRMADTREQMQWERENFPKLDAWYEEGTMTRSLRSAMKLMRQQTVFLTVILTGSTGIFFLFMTLIRSAWS